MRASFHGQRGRRRARSQSIIHIAASERAKRHFARNSDQNRAPDLRQLSQIPQQLDIVLCCLAKTKAWINDQQIFAEPGRYALCHPLAEELRDLCHNIVVIRLFLHRPGLSLHVHEADRSLQAHRGLQRAIFPQRANIVDQGCTR